MRGSSLTLGSDRVYSPDSEFSSCPNFTPRPSFSASEGLKKRVLQTVFEFRMRATEVTRVCPSSFCLLALFHISQGIGVCGTGLKLHLEIPPQPKGGVLTRVFRRFRPNRPKTIFRASWRMGGGPDLTLVVASKSRNCTAFAALGFRSGQRTSTTLAEKPFPGSKQVGFRKSARN